MGIPIACELGYIKNFMDLITAIDIIFIAVVTISLVWAKLGLFDEIKDETKENVKTEMKNKSSHSDTQTSTTTRTPSGVHFNQGTQGEQHSGG